METFEETTFQTDNIGIFSGAGKELQETFYFLQYIFLYCQNFFLYF